MSREVVPVKRLVQGVIRGVHLAAFDRGVPARAGVYGHALEEGDRPGLRATVEYFRSQGYRFVDPLELVDGPEPCVSLSFDDSYRSWHSALPLLDELGVSATFYVNTAVFRDRARPAEVQAYFDRVDHRGDRTTLSTSELLELAAAGHTIGCHTHTHPVLARLPDPVAREEISRSKTILEDLLGADVVHFSYPFGMRRHFTDALREYCLSIGLETVANGILGMQHAGQRPEAIQRTRWALRRPVEYNAANLSVDGRLYERLTGRCAVT